MSDATLLERTRQLLVGLAAGMFVATMIELAFAKHYDGWVQLIPWFCCMIGLVSAALVWKNRTASYLKAMRAVMGLIVAASVFGMYEHLEASYANTRDFHPGIGGWEMVRTTLQSSTPILAPGALAAGAFVILIATYGLTSAKVATQPATLRRA